MSAATSPRDTIQSGHAAVPSLYSYPVKSGHKLIQGAMAFLKQGFLYGSPNGGFAVGIAENEYDNSTGADGAITATIRAGVFTFAGGSGEDGLSTAHIGLPCCAVDNQTIGVLGSSDTVAGVVIDVSSAGVQVAVRPGAVTMYPDKSFTIAQLNYFASGELTGDGTPQHISHGLGDVPALVIVYPTDTLTGTYKMTEGAHTAADIVVTVTDTKKFKVVAFL